MKLDTKRFIWSLVMLLIGIKSLSFGYKIITINNLDLKSLVLASLSILVGLFIILLSIKDLNKLLK